MQPLVTDGEREGGGVVDALAWFVGVVVRRQSYLNLGYLLLAFPLGLAYFVIYAIGFTLGLGLSIFLIGIPLIALMIGFALVLASLERRLTNRLLATRATGHRPSFEGRLWRELRSIALDRETWSAVLYLPMKFALGLVSFVLVFTVVPTAIALLSVPLYYDQPGLYVGIVTERAPEIHHTIYLGWNYLLVGIEAVVTFGYWEVETLGAALVVSVVGVIGLFSTLHVCNGLAWIWARYATWSLDGSVDLLGVLADQ